MFPSFPIKPRTGTGARLSVPALLRRVGLSPERRILCRPRALRPRMLLAKIFEINGYRAVMDPDAPHEFSVHVASPAARLVVNGRHRDNRKTTVARAWQAASGQALEVDPTWYDGPMVEKSDANATHDGRVLDGPIDPSRVQAGKVYQKLIDNAEGGMVVDLRVTFHGDRIPLVYRKRRPLETRFSNTNADVEIVQTGAVFDAGEQRVLLRFAALAGLDFGEADVLRDKASGRIWVVDSTNGPAGPPNGLTPRDSRVAARRLARAFDAMLDAAARG